MNQDEFFMNRALELAREGWGRTNPNPLVGAVIVKENRIIAEGYHQVLGCAHAEIAAFNNAKEDVRGSTLYVNLEPCSHYGRTPPCAWAVIEAGIREVVIAMNDPNPKVAGRGIEMLKAAGVVVRIGILEQEARKLNEIFIKYITKQLPFVILKTAMTLDGKIAASSGDSKWVTGEQARLNVHSIRDRVAAIMVGIQTVIKDDPSLTTRLPSKKGKDPVRIVVDSKGILPEEGRLVNVESDAGVILATTSAIKEEKEKKLMEKGVKIIKAEGSDHRVDLRLLMEELYKLEIDSVLLEGGGTLNASALKSGIVDKVMFYIAPKILGGFGSLSPVGGEDPLRMQQAYNLKDMEVSRIGQDVLIEAYMD